ncbi:MAG: 2-hydroxyglutaryl-CoA dehydratase [Syntrophaceae bacterium]|nr:2-hydroxyglutaryl-CoA dehydratase [Syntrophaceae bacterium]
MFAGIDIGSVSTKACLLSQEGVILSYSIISTGARPASTGSKALEQALESAGRKRGEIRCIVATGYGRVSLADADKTVTEISCHAKGAHFLDPATDLVIDIGGQDSKVIRLDREGSFRDFAMNDRCAAGTGRFLEVMARALEVRLEEMGDLSLEGVPVSISNMCTVFAESEVVSLVAREVEKERIIAGIHKSVAERTAALVNRVGLGKKVMLVGGVAKNRGLKAALEKALNIPLFVPEEPQIVGALGAAISAIEHSEGIGLNRV